MLVVGQGLHFRFALTTVGAATVSLEPASDTATTEDCRLATAAILRLLA